MRLNKFISESGYTSRRGADKLIEQKRVKVNGKVAGLGVQVSPGDVVLVDGNRLANSSAEQLVYLVLNKPYGITSTSEKNVKGNIIDFVNYPLRIFHVGRLDKESTGLIMLTNDGDIVNKILRSENKHEKEYVVSVDKPITPEFLKTMAAGVNIGGEKTLPCTITQNSKFEFTIILTQGLNRQIRRMCEALGYEVVTLNRIRIMNIHLKNLPIGQWRDLTKKEKEQLFKDLGHQ
ncbi:MAG: pseudouridine synthase family protein [Bacillales bacterium]|jgi:23S rRNA pseudouridine2604 synthase|nr:pseudouridine synthase family protein [Bacillales bacterium]